MQSCANGILLPWLAGQSRTPHVIAKFGNGVEINITDTPDFQNDAVGLTDYPFDRLPSVGEGLICLNNTAGDIAGGYNFHLGAVIASSANAVLISNMMEASGVRVGMVTASALEINTWDQFRSLNFGTSSGNYALGLLQVDR